MQRFEVKQAGFEEHRVADVPRQELAEGEVRLSVDLFAFTANNMTYAVAGDMLKYWDFFPVNDDPSFGVIPVWGFADVTESKADHLGEGERLYGYFPPAEELIIRPTNVSGHQVFDGSAHRQALPPLYNRYQRVTGGGANQQVEQLQALLGPLFMTGFCLWDQLSQNQWYNAEQVVILSASSKTSLGLAQAIADGGESPSIVGVTSQSNSEFVNSVGLYDAVLSYEEISELSAVPTVVVDMAGNKATGDGLRAKLGDQLQYFISVGLTHWDKGGDDFGKPVPKHEFFFAPRYMMERITAEPGDFARQMQAIVVAGAAKSASWLTVIEEKGIDALAQRYPQIRVGHMNPAEGLIIKV